MSATAFLRLKNVAAIGAGQSPPSNDVHPYYEEGLPFLQGNAEFGMEHPLPIHRCDVAPRTAQPGDLLVSVRAPVGEVNLADRSYGIGRGLASVRPHGIDQRYMFWLVQSASEWLNSVATGSTFTAITGQDLGNVVVPITRGDRQRAIADFLDRETARIDAFIAKNEELIALLAERRTASATVLGATSVGAGRRLKHHLREVDVRAGDAWPDLPLLSVSISWGVRRRDEVTDDAPQALDMSNYKVAQSGDIVLNRMRAFQGALGVAPERGLVSPDYAVLRSRGGADPHWMSLVMRTQRFVGEMTSRLKGIGSTESGAVRTPRINVADLNEIRVELPAREVQAAQIAEIDAEIARIDRAAATATRAIDLARERRAALISAAVTGKIDVGVGA